MDQRGLSKPDALQPLDVLVAERMQGTLDAVDALVRFAGEIGTARGMRPKRADFEKPSPGSRG